MKPLRLQESSWRDVQAYLDRDDRCLVPVGSTEQHGGFAPLGTDTYVALSLAEDASSRAAVMVTPPLWFGWSPHHMVRPGTVTLRAEVLIEVLADLLGSLAHHGFKKFVVVNGHRIVNLSWMQIAAQRVQAAFGVRVALFDPAYMSKEIAAKLGFGTIGHAEEIEISHMLHCHPELVVIADARDNPQAARPLYHLDPQDPRDTLCYVPATLEEMRATLERSGDTVAGCPTAASAEKGRAYHQHLVDRLGEVLALLGSGKPAIASAAGSPALREE